MQRVGRTRIAVFAVATLAALALAAPVRASVQAEADCTIGGFMDTSGVGILSNTGTYTFDSSGAIGGFEVNCLTNLGKNQTVGVVDISMTSIGTFTNIMCGTDFFTSTSNDVTSAFATATNPSDEAELEAFWLDPSTEAALDYKIFAAGTKGFLVFQGTPDPLLGLWGYEPGDAIGTGDISITDPTPSELNTPPGTCTTDLAVSGTMHPVFVGEEPVPEPDDVLPPGCPSGQVGTPPACAPQPGGACPAGQLGAQPACVSNPIVACPPGQVGTQPACVPLPSGPGQYSNTCTDANAKVVDGFAGSAYMSLRVQDNPANPQETWICYRLWNATGSVDLGGRVDLDRAAFSPGLPVLEADSTGCSVTPINTTVGDPGDPTYGPYVVGVNSTPSQARACFRVGSSHQRVTVPVPGVGGGVPQVNQDDPTVPDPTERAGNPAYPSTTCQSTPGNTRLANLESGGTWISAYSAPGAPGETRLCVRAQGAVSHGGMLTLKSSTGVSPVVQGPIADTAPSPCTSNVVTNDADPARYSIKRSPGTGNPASICLSVGSSGPFGPPGQRLTLGTSGSPSAPVVWTPDPGTPG